ncbi:PA2169 family four-helix-bundle protein [Hymenobacter koreensis]|uniref:DUF2383 domain-containing protein n=1 Tax=Hymenobacter koreensis TaxID=1084523 RepID=A0ABP8JM96_9BACT
MTQPQQPTGSNYSSTSSTQSTSAGGGSVLDQASQWLGQGRVSDLLNQLPQSFKDTGNQALTSFNKLSTTQKVVGGALIALGVGYLATSGKSRKNGSQAATLHELLLFVNDRIEGYQRAVDESQDPQLRGYYKQLVSQSQRFANELNQYLRQQGGHRETGTTLKGKLYRGWMETKAALTGYSEQAILGSNVYGEEWALKAYEDALNDHTLTGHLRQVVEQQYAQSQKTYYELKKLEAKHQSL